MCRLLAACLAGSAGLVAMADEAPRRVLSMNLCTDQLAMQLAAPGQLISISRLAQDPHFSAMPDQAAGFPANDGLAEQIFLMQPDLILAGSLTAPATLALLRRLNQRVEVFAPETDFDDLRANMLRMGRVLGREAEAQAAVARFDADLAALREDPGDPSHQRPRTAIYDANSYSPGPDSLAGDIIDAAGFANIGAELGLGAGGALPLEVLAMSDPDLVVTGQPYPGASRAEEVLGHPALRALKARAPFEIALSREWVCGTPLALDAVARLKDAREAM